MFSKKQHDVVKALGLYILPLIAAVLWFIYNIEYDSKIFYIQGCMLGLILAFNTLLKIDSKLYSGNGTMFIDDSDPDRLVCRMELDSDLDDILDKESITFIVKKAILD